MKIQVNTDRNIEGSEALVGVVESDVADKLGRFADRLTRVEVHLGDEDGEKDGSGSDKRCLIEVRPAGMDPLVVTANAGSAEQACRDASRKMQQQLTKAFGRLDDRDRNSTTRKS